MAGRTIFEISTFPLGFKPTLINVSPTPDTEHTNKFYYKKIYKNCLAFYTVWLGRIIGKKKNLYIFFKKH